MTKIELIQDYINKCENAINSNDFGEAYLLYREICKVYSKEISEIYNPTTYALTKADEDCMKKIVILKATLINFKANLEREDEIRKDELEKFRLQSAINIHNNNTNNNSSKATATSNVTITIEQTIGALSSVPQEKLSDEEKKKLVADLYELELAKSDKKTLKEKIPTILKNVAEKSFEVGKVVLPFISELMRNN